MAIKKNDFIEIDYTGKTKSDGIVFDTTVEKTAKDNDMHNSGMKYGSIIICVGENQVLKGLDKALVGKEPGEYDFKIPAKDAFGMKSAKNIQLISTAKFRKQDLNPVPGMQVNIDNMVGIVKTVTGGRTMVDFNHPLASQDLSYHVNIIKIVTDDLVKSQSFLNMMFGPKNVDVALKEGNMKIVAKVALPEEIKTKVEEKLKDLIPSIKKIDFIVTNSA